MQIDKYVVPFAVGILCIVAVVIVVGSLYFDVLVGLVFGIVVCELIIIGLKMVSLDDITLESNELSGIQEEHDSVLEELIRDSHKDTASKR